MVVEFEVEGAPGYEESLSLTLHNFGDGSDFDAGLCWFEIKEKAIFRRQHLRACLNARIAMQERSNRLRQSERGCGQCGFRAVMRQLLTPTLTLTLKTSGSYSQLGRRVHA